MMGWIRALRLYLALTGLLGVAYPLVVTLAAQWLFPHKANGSLIERDGKVIGSALVGRRGNARNTFTGDLRQLITRAIAREPLNLHSAARNFSRQSVNG
jgi:K+-transporting ATPase c subunit